MAVTDEERSYWIALTRFRAFGAVRIALLAKSFPTMADAWRANAGELTHAGLDPRVAREFVAVRDSIDPAAEFERTRVLGVQALTPRDEAYPPLLKKIYDPPAVLYVRGTLPEATRPHLAVVGSRHPSTYGPRAVRFLIEPVAKAGVVIVSGLALGIDALAHQAAVDADGATIAVLGSGVDDENIFPSTNRPLADRILAGHGALVSEFPLGVHPLKQHFPFRNRVIAGLARATLIVEAAAKSGSLITARAALEENREVWAVPGPVDSPLSEGPHRLLRTGATPITSPNDILDQFNLPSVPYGSPAGDPNGEGHAASYTPASPEERAILEALGSEPLHMDELTRAANLSAPVTSSTLTQLELNGAVRHVGGRHYVKT